MTISDLTYLETVSDASSVIGSGRKFKYFDIDVQINYSTIYQKAKAYAYAEAYKGDAYASATAYNTADVDQTNK